MKRNSIARDSQTRFLLPKAAVVVTISVGIALIHVFRIGRYLTDNLFTLYYSYFSDIVVPFGMYFLLCMNDLTLRFLKDWKVKAFIVFGIATITEILQAFGVPLLGVTFDPLDILMFAIGVGLAVVLDVLVFSRRLPFWSPRE